MFYTSLVSLVQCCLPFSIQTARAKTGYKNTSKHEVVTKLQSRLIYEKNEKLLLYRWRNLVRLHFPYFAKKCSFMCQFHEIFRLFPVIIFEYCSRCFCRADFKNRKLNLFSIFSNTRIAHIKSISLNLSRYFRGDTQIV